MPVRKIIPGFSRLTTEQKRLQVAFLAGDEGEKYLNLLSKHLYADEAIQNRYGEFSENTVSNYYLPFGVAPNFLINGEVYHLPMVTEESSVVAAASAGAGYWLERGGFRCEVLGTVKTGQVHFTSSLTFEQLNDILTAHRAILLESLSSLEENMRRRGGGVQDLELVRVPGMENDYYQLRIYFETADSMGANFINSCLEHIAKMWQQLVQEAYPQTSGSMEILMAILSNYTPGCIVRCTVQERVDRVDDPRAGLDGAAFVRKFILATQVAQNDPYRAVTHNKGIFNGIDAVVMATGNDFRAVEAAGHAYASREGRYAALSRAWTDSDYFHFELEIPLSLGTVGGLTRLHPLAEFSLKIVGNPSAEELMKLVAAAGLANNFSAVRSLVTSGIQQGHMKLHLSNLLNEFSATDEEKNQAVRYFAQKTVSHRSVEEYLKNLRSHP